VTLLQKIYVYDAHGCVIDIGSGDMAGKVFNELYAAHQLRARISKGTDAVGRQFRNKRRRRRKALLHKLKLMRDLVEELLIRVSRGS